jgi:hypothetical protein
MASPVSYVQCPGCAGRFYIYRPDFEQHAEAYCFCPFCRRTFEVEEGRPYPALGARVGAPHPA